jgi:DNA-binding response OmpR family regulator
MKRKYTVLLADDDKVLVTMLSSQLRAKGYSVAVAFDATSAFMVAMKSPPDVVILDIQMPGGTGKAVLERLKGSSKTAQVPVIVLSGFSDRRVIEEVRALGAFDYLSKPADVDRIDTAIRRALSLPASDAPPAGPPASTPPASTPPASPPPAFPPPAQTP